ncbi:MAG: hypothetical protein JSS04_20475 [Proteobacteria bacterium]|nr:hypothetical protein [Pseudomonadota bacterium]
MSFVVTGCFDFTANSKFQRDGKAQVDVELAVSMQLAALASGLNQSDNTKGDLLDGCQQAWAKDNLPVGIRSVSISRGTRGEMMTCTARFVVDDPVKAAAAWKPPADRDEGLKISRFSFEQLSPKAYRLAADLEASPTRNDPANDQNPFMAGFLAAMAGHYITVSMTADRIENTTGELSNEARTVTWKLPITMLMSPPVGFRQEIRADIIYDNQSWFDRLLESVGLGGTSSPPPAQAKAPLAPFDEKAEARTKLAADLLTSQKQLVGAQAALQQAQDELQAADRSLAEKRVLTEQITVANARFWYSAQRFGSDEPVISFTLENKGKIAIKRIFMEGTLQTPGRSVPWLKETFNSEVPGGIEPGEKHKFDLAPNRFGEWGKVPKDVVGTAVLTLRLVAFEDPSGQKLGDESESLSKRAKAEERKGELEGRVKSLENRIGELTQQLK